MSWIEHTTIVPEKGTAKPRRTRFARYGLILLIGVALLADLLANEKPLIARHGGEIWFPVFRSYLADAGLVRSVEEMEWDWAFYPPVPYSPGNMDYANAQAVGPLDEQRVESIRWRHWLGTDELGRDVLAGLIHGSRYAVAVGVVSMGIASVIGILLGALAGFWGDHGLRLSRARFILLLTMLLPAWFYAFHLRQFVLNDALRQSLLHGAWELLLSLVVFSGIIGIGVILSLPLQRLRWLREPVRVPVDMLVSRLIEVIVSVPALFLIISLLAIAGKPSLLLVMLVIGLTAWTGIARFIRAEMLRIRRMEYIQAARVMGFSTFRILFRHALPNALRPAMIAIAFGVAAAILAESTLSFLGIGVPPETVTWGSLLSTARHSISAWWLAVFPGLAIFFTVIICNLLGDELADRLEVGQDGAHGEG